MHSWHWLWYLLYAYLLIGAILQIFFIKAEIEEYYDDIVDHFEMAYEARQQRPRWTHPFLMVIAILICSCGVIYYFMEWCFVTSIMIVTWPGIFFMVPRHVREQIKKIPRGTPLRDIKYYVRMP